MSMVKTLAKAAIGIAVAKGVGSMVSGGRRGSGRSSGGIEDLLGAALGGGNARGRGGSAGGGIEDLLGAVLGGGAGGALAGGRGGGASGGIEDLLGAVLGGGSGGAGTGKPYGGPASRNQAGASGGLGGVLGQLLGGQGPRGRGSMGGALDELSRISTGSLAGAGMAEASKPFDRPGQGSFGELFDQSLNSLGEPARTPTRDEEALAEVLLRALIQAAKADGQIDSDEKRQLTEHLGEMDQEEIAFVRAEMNKPVDVRALARDVPKGAEAQTYMMSLMGIDLDSKQEAQYLGELAQALGIQAEQANAIHDRMGEPRIFS